MTQQTCEALINETDDIIAAGWPYIAARLRQDWRNLSDDTISNIQGRAGLLTSALTLAYEISRDKAERITLALARDFDRFESTNHMQETMRSYWPRLTPESFQTVKGRRSVLTSVLQTQYNLSRAEAWHQVKGFFAQIK